jgi:hypothetical protein
VDGIKILHARNGREYRLPELPHLRVDGFFPEKRKVLFLARTYMSTFP